MKKKTKVYMPASVRIGKSKTGLGMYAVEPIKKGDFIIEYIGKKLPTKVAEEKGGRYLFELNSKWTIDGVDRKNKARYINHSCRPNCEVDIKGGRILVFAIKNIKPGEELNYDYGEEYFDDYFKGPGCKCGECDGTGKLIKKIR